MLAKLIICPELLTRVEAMERILQKQNLKRDHVDVLWLDDQKLGVEQAKKIRQHLYLKPYSAPGRVVVVENFSLMTDEAQNSLLKTLEEPPVEAIILLGSGSEKNILPTILSRVESVILNDSKKLSTNGEIKSLNKLGAPLTHNDIQKLMNSTIEERFDYIEKLENKEDLLLKLLDFFHQQLTANHDRLTINFIKDLMTAEEWAAANGNIRAILEFLMLRLRN